MGGNPGDFGHTQCDFHTPQTLTPGKAGKASPGPLGDSQLLQRGGPLDLVDELCEAEAELKLPKRPRPRDPGYRLIEMATKSD